MDTSLTPARAALPRLEPLAWRYNLARECAFYFRACRNWREVMRCRRGRVGLDQLNLRNGLSIAVHEHDPAGVTLSMFREIWQAQSYTAGYSGTPAVVVDIGAHVGMFSLYAARRWPKATIFSIEPEPKNFALLKRNIEANGMRQIRPLNLAVAGSSGHALLCHTAKSDSHSLIAPAGANGGEEDRHVVSTVTLTEVLGLTLGGRIDFLKIDCEGAEFDFFARQEQHLKSSVGYVAGEYHEWGGRSRGELVEVFSRAGFKVRVEPRPRLPIGDFAAQNGA